MWVFMVMTQASNREGGNFWEIERPINAQQLKSTSGTSLVAKYAKEFATMINGKKEIE